MRAVWLFALAQDGAQPVADFFKLPPDMSFKQASAVAGDSAGNIFVFHRGEPPILVFDPNGAYLRSFGKGLFKSSHGLRIDRNDNVWATDNGNHTVVKFDHGGKTLLVLGERDVPGEDGTHFNMPTDIAFAADGSVFVSDGYGNSRVVKFDSDGKFVKTWGRKGHGPGEFHLPHGVRIDSLGRVFVADRENKRVQVFDQEGTYLWEFGGFAPYGLFITPEDVLYVADGLNNKILRMTLKGEIRASWGGKGQEPGKFRMAHSVTVSGGALFVAEIDGRRVQKFVPAK